LKVNLFSKNCEQDGTKRMGCPWGVSPQGRETAEKRVPKWEGKRAVLPMVETGKEERWVKGQW